MKNSQINPNKNINPKKGFFYFSSKDPEIESIKFFKIFTENFPMAQNVLMCNEYTKEEEICVFLYRAFFDKNNRLYLILNSDNLNLEKKNYLFSILKELKLKTE